MSAGRTPPAAMTLVLELAAAPRLSIGDGEAIALAPLDAALLVWLALEGATPRARIAQLLWPEKHADAARNSLRQRLFQLRRQAGVELVTGSATLSLADGVSHDLEDADTVLGHPDGDDLPAGEFAAWLGMQRLRRRDRVRRALTELADRAEAVRDWDDALTHARELVALEPLSEESHRRVMRLHYLAGDRAAALLAFDRCEQLLKHEVGTAPSDDTLALLRTVQAAANAADEAAGPAVLAVAPRIPASVLRPPRLIGRDAAWAQLAEAWHAGGCAIVVGEAGLGKSRLAGDFAQSQGRALLAGARPGDARVVYASASRLLRALPRAALDATTPVLALRFEDETAASVDHLVADLRAGNVPVFLAGGKAGTLPWLGDDHPVTDAIAMLVPVYRAIEAAARARGFDPDRPPHLNKVTRTL